MTFKVVKRSIAIAGHRTSVSIEEPFWEALKALAASQGRTVTDLIAEIDSGRGEANLSSAIRVFVLNRVHDQCHSCKGRGDRMPSQFMTCFKDRRVRSGAPA